MVLAVGVLSAGGISGRDLARAHEHLLRIFDGAKTLQVAIPLSSHDKDRLFAACNQRWPGDTLMIFASFRARTLAGYGVVDNVKGKDQLITYLVAVDPSLAVKDLEIIAYREAYGGEVGYKSWQKQFLGKQPGDNLRPGREIKNISGATISARSVTLGVTRVLAMLAVVRDRLPRTPVGMR